MRQTDISAADEEQASLLSSEPLLKRDVCDSDDSSINTRGLGRRSAQAPGNDNECRRKYSNASSIPNRPRWMTARRGFYRDEKSMRGHKSRFCARIGLGTLVFL